MGREWWLCCWSLLLVQGLLLRCHGHGCWEEERLALLRLLPSFQLFDRDPYSPHSDCCNWDSNMILCDNATDRLTKLHLSHAIGYLNSNGGSYYLNASLFLPFQHLTTLDLSFNLIDGCVENEGFERLSSLRNLETLDLTNTSFNNNVLASLQHLSSLRSLNLSFNRLNGSLNVHEFDGLYNLEELDLGSNPIESFVSSNDGKILEKLKMLDLSNVDARGSNLLQFAGLFPSLTTLDLSWNTFNDSTTGKEMNALTKLEQLDLSDSSIQANFLQAFGALPSLQVLEMSDCNVAGLQQQLDGLCGLSNLRKLDMRSNELNGNLPLCFSNLTALEYLDLSGNQLRVPSSLSPFLNLSKLREFYASNNEIYADMESNLSVPTFQLERLHLSGHGSGGAFPEFLYHQHELEGVGLSNISFSRQHFPTWLLENNTKLERIYLANASLSGSLKFPGHPLRSLSRLDISDNLLIGGIPPEIGAFFPILRKLDISNNQLKGSIPSSIGDMKQLHYLDLSNNKLSGEIPTSLAQGCSSLGYLILSNNSLQGEIPNGLSRCSSLETLDFSDNNLSGGIPPWLGNVTSLRSIIMSNNALEGPLPEQLFNLPYLQILDLSGNLISGTIPSSLNLPLIIHIHLSNNKLQGRLPTSLCKSIRVITLDLSNNLFVDGIPRCIGELHELSYLILKHNSIKGEIPLKICKLHRLSVMDLSYNNLSGSIPSCLRITTLNEVFISLGGLTDIASTSEPVEFQTKRMSYSYKGKMLSFLSGIDLSYNKFIGSIPEEIGRLNMINTLNLSHNNLSGGIPFTISKLSQVESLDLSFNNLQGGIPPQIVDLKFLSSFYVSFNNLSGPTPKRVDQFGTFEEDSYKGNHFLCGEPLPSCNPAGPQFRNPIGSAHETEDGGLMDMGVFYISLISSYVTSLLVVLLVWWINPYWGRKWFYYVDMTTTSCYYYIVDHLPKCF